MIPTGSPSIVALAITDARSSVGVRPAVLGELR